MNKVNPLTLPTVGSLFSGIGGFDLGLERAGFQIVYQVENNPFCQQVLQKHFPSTRKYHDVEDFPPVYGRESLFTDLLVAGFPCTDVSKANAPHGKHQGMDGARSGLWKEVDRCIGIFRPKVVLLENSPVLLRHGWFTRILHDLFQRRYHAQWSCLPAFSVGSPQQRDRLFVVAYTDQFRQQGLNRSSLVAQRKLESLGHAAPWELFTCSPSEDWLPEPRVGRLADGTSSPFHRLVALGNGVIPQIAEMIGKSILKARLV